MSDLTQTIRNIVSHQMEPFDVIEVRVLEDEDKDGEKILRIHVVVDTHGRKLDPVKVAGMARHLREPLEALHEQRFPLVSYFSPGELDGAAA